MGFQQIIGWGSGLGVLNIFDSFEMCKGGKDTGQGGSGIGYAHGKGLGPKGLSCALGLWPEIVGWCSIVGCRALWAVEVGAFPFMSAILLVRIALAY